MPLIFLFYFKRKWSKYKITVLKMKYWITIQKEKNWIRNLPWPSWNILHEVSCAHLMQGYSWIVCHKCCIWLALFHLCKTMSMKKKKQFFFIRELNITWIFLCSFISAMYPLIFHFSYVPSNLSFQPCTLQSFISAMYSPIFHFSHVLSNLSFQLCTLQSFISALSNLSFQPCTLQSFISAMYPPIFHFSHVPSNLSFQPCTLQSFISAMYSPIFHFNYEPFNLSFQPSTL